MPGARSAAIAPGIERVVALYEIEMGGEIDPDAVIGTARVRGGPLASGSIEPWSRNIAAGEVTRDWATNSRAFRLAVLGAEIATLTDDVSSAVVARLRAELERLRAESDGRDAQRADELLSVLAR
jgi:hypothetical protein